MSKQLTIVGDNYISKQLYQDFKRYGKYTPNIISDITHLHNNTNFIIDTTFNSKLQKLSINYTKINNIDKLIILNHWQILDINEPNITQLIIYDVISEDHPSFNRCGYGNEEDGKIHYCNFISEALRRIHEYKIGGIPNLYLNYGENDIKYTNINNIHKPLLNLLKENIPITSYFDGQRRTEHIIYMLKEIIDYNGTITFHNNHEYFTHNIKKIDMATQDNIYSNIRKLYYSLKFNNNRFEI